MVLGPDSCLISDLVGFGTARLARVVIECLWLGAVPHKWVKGRTILFPKVPSPLAEGDLHPITITNQVTRQMNEILARWLDQDVPLQQKGFMWEKS